MKKLSVLICAVLLFLAFASCSDEFLFNNQRDSFYLLDTLFLTSNQTDVEISVVLPVSKESGFSIFIQPKWLSFNSMRGTVINSSAALSFSIDTTRTNQDYQTQYGLIGIDVEGAGFFTFTVAFNNIPPDLVKINGMVTDAEFSRSAGIMVIATRSPNSVLIYRPSEKEIKTISLEKTPQCVSLSEDGHEAAVGFSENSVGYVDIAGLQLKNDFSIDCVPWDIALGENGWCYISPAGDGWVYFRSLNLETGELAVGTTWGMIYEKTVIKKLKSKPYLLGSRMTTSPSGILLFDISNGEASNTITYYHTNLGPFMVPEDGSRIYTQDGTVYSMPEPNGLFNVGSPPVIGQLQTSTPYFSTFEELKSRGSILGVVLYNYLDVASFPIDEFNIYTLNKIRTFNAAPVYIIENGNGKLYPTKPQFIFADEQGSTLYVLKNIIPVYNKDYWTIEAIGL